MPFSSEGFDMLAGSNGKGCIKGAVVGWCNEAP
jgi:hypothetical protein